MKSTLTTLISLSFSVLLAGACALDGVSGDTPPEEGGLSLLSNGPDLPEECNACWDDFQTCFAEGNAPEDCAQGIIGCIDACQAPPPPDECLHCAAGFDACATTAQESGDSGEDCAVGFEGCLSSCEAVVGCEQIPDACDPPLPPQGDDCDQCDKGFDACVNEQWGDENGQDPSNGSEMCQQQMEDCFQTCDSGPGDGAPDPTEPNEDLCHKYEEFCVDGNQNVLIVVNGQELSCDDLQDHCSP